MCPRTSAEFGKPDRVKKKIWIAIAAGGTGGHVYPAFAVLKTLLRKETPVDILFFGRKSGLERRLVSQEAVEYVGLGVRGIPRRLSLRWLTSPLMAIGALLKVAWRFICHRPRLVIGFGSYVSAPVLVAAICLRIPTAIHEQNSVPGVTNKLLAPWVTRVLVANRNAAERLGLKRCEVVGIPLREEVLSDVVEPERLGLERTRNTLLIFGGSQGARKICQAATGALRSLERQLAEWQVLFVTGPNNYAEVAAKRLPANVIVKDYVDDMASVYAVTTLAVARAGAVSLAEMTAKGIPAILIPLRIAAGDHQRMNADWLNRKGAAAVIEETELNEETLAAKIEEIACDPVRLSRMAEASKAEGNPGATEAFVEQIDRLLEA